MWTYKQSFLLPSEWADQSNSVVCIWHVSISAMGTIYCSALSQNIGHVALCVNAVHNKLKGPTLPPNTSNHPFYSVGHFQLLVVQPKR